MAKGKDRAYTIDDMAGELGVSKTTVSRAISGKGRVSEETRQRVLELMERHHYRPNAAAKSLAQNRTFNLALVLPEDCGSHHMPFFQSCMTGICEVASAHDYDVLVTMVRSGDLRQLERILRNRKVDGVIVGRSTVGSPEATLLKAQGIPFVAIGRSADPDILTVDDDNQAAAFALTSLLVDGGLRHLALLGGEEQFYVTQSRLQGFREACPAAEEELIFLNIDDGPGLDAAIDRILAEGADCVVCMDDYLCQLALVRLRERQVAVPDDICLASFYDSGLLEHNLPPITSLRFDAKALGAAACRTLLERLEGESPACQVLSGYQVMLRGSTERP